MSEVGEAILAAIKKSLPEATAGELKKFIEEANTTTKLLASAQARNLALEEQVRTATATISELATWRQRAITLDTEERHLASEKLKLHQQQEILYIRNECEAAKTQNMFEVLRTVFKAQPVGYAFTRSVHENGQDAAPGGQYGCTVPTNKNTNESITKKEITE